MKRDPDSKKVFLRLEIIIRIGRKLHCLKNGFQKFQIAIRLTREVKLEILLVSTTAKILRKSSDNSKLLSQKILKKSITKEK